MLLLAMQALGKPGANQVKMIEWWHFAKQNPMPVGIIYPNIGAAGADMPKMRRFDMKEQAKQKPSADGKFVPRR